VEKATTEAPYNATDLSDTHAPTPEAEETAQEPLIGLHQDQQLNESANEAAQPYDPAPVTEGLNASYIDAIFQEPQSMILVSRCTKMQVI
jgi:hypothetical protein